MAEVDRWVILSLEDTTRLELDESGNATTVLIPAGSVVNICLWDGETPWVPPEGTRVMRESEYLQTLG